MTAIGENYDLFDPELAFDRIDPRDLNGPPARLREDQRQSFGRIDIAGCEPRLEAQRLDWVRVCGGHSVQSEIESDAPDGVSKGGGFSVGWRSVEIP